MARGNLLVIARPLCVRGNLRDYFICPSGKSVRNDNGGVISSAVEKALAF